MSWIKWHDVKTERWKAVGGICEICRKPVELTKCIGHHKINRIAGGFDVLKNCQVRCCSCENWAHKVSRDGNPDEYQIQGRRHRGR